MARPESIKDIQESDRYVRVAMFEVDKIIANSTLLKHYTALLEAAQKIGGNADKSYNTVDVNIPKSQAELEYQLQCDQSSWDESQKYYNLAVNRGPDCTDIPEWRRSGIIRWAKDNDLPDPFDVFAANDPELAQIRADLNMEGDSE